MAYQGLGEGGSFLDWLVMVGAILGLIVLGVLAIFAVVAIIIFMFTPFT